MLKYFKNVNKFGLVAILLAGTTAFAFKAPAYTNSNHHLNKHKEADLYWYNVVAGKTSGTQIFEGTKDDALGQTSCTDAQMPVCLFGSTDANLANNTPVGNPPADNRILHQ